MSPTATLWLIGGCMLATCLAAIAAKSLRQFSRQKLEAICRRRKAKNLWKEILLNHGRVLLGVETLKVLTTAVLVGASSSWIWQRSIAAETASPSALATVWSAFAAAALLLLVVEIWLAQAIANLWSEAFLFYTWGAWRMISLALSPLTGVARFCDVLLHRLAGRPRVKPTEESIEEEIRAIVSEGHREGLLEEDAREMIEGVIELGDAVVSEILTPRTDMVFMPLSSDLDEAVKFIVSVSHTRIPVYSKNHDDVIGILHAKDLLRELAKSNPRDRLPIEQILREPYFVPETKRVDDLLEEFQLKHNHMAIVLDEYGGVSGLVTIEDVLEEIVGEIIDEYDEDIVDEIRRVDEKTFETLARVHVDEINEQLGLEIPDDGEYETIGGFVFHELGRIPVVDEELVWRNVRITVLAVTRRRIERLKIEVLGGDQRESA